MRWARPVVALALVALSACAPAERRASRPAGKLWDFERGADRRLATDPACRVVPEPGVPGNHALQIEATRPHHTRLVLPEGASLADFLLACRVKVLDWEGAAPTVYLYGRSGREGFRGAQLDTGGGQILCWYGQRTPSRAFGRLAIGIGREPRWLRVAFACFGDHVLAKTWPEGTPEPGWQAQGKASGQDSGVAAVGVWTSPQTPSTARVLFDDIRLAPLTPDMLAALHIDIEPRLPLDAMPLPPAPAAFELRDRIGLAAGRAAVAFDRRTGEVTNVLDVPTGREFVAPDVRAPLFRLVLTQPSEGRRQEATSRDFADIRVRQDGPHGLRLDFARHPTLPLAVSVTAAVADDAIALRAEVTEPAGAWCVAALTFPQIPMRAVLGDNDGDDRLLLPWSGGAVLPSPGRQGVRRDVSYPGQAFAQFHACYDATAGLYVAMDDAAGHCKRYHLRSHAGQSVSLDVEHLFPEVAGNRPALPYRVLVRTFRGDWRDAADIYKAWAVRQPWCLRTLAERREVPSFLKDGAGVLITGIQNANGYTGRFGERMEKLPDLLDAYRERTGLEHMVFVPYGWENRGTWAGINYLPTVPGDDVWREVNAELRKRGHRTAFLTSGYWWVVKRQKTSNGPAFDDTADFERRKGMCAMRPDGTPHLVDSYERTTEHGSWRGLSATLCHGSRAARDTLKATFLRLAALGVPLVSFDQEIGGEQRYPCYSKAHGHPPGHGAWMWADFRGLCAEILAEGKPLNPELGLFLENVSELAIPQMATYWSRQFGEVDCGATGGRGVGLFSYLYHEYVTAIGAACVQGQGQLGTRPHPWLRCRVLANNLTRGLIPGPFIHEVPLEGGDAWTKTVAEAYFAFCKPYRHFPEYLLLGKTVRPLPVRSKEVEVWFWRRSRDGKPLREGGPPVAKVPIKLPAVTAGAFAAADGTVACFVVNTTPEPQEATVTLPPDASVAAFDAVRRPLPATEVSHPKGATLTLEPFGVRVLIVRTTE